VAIPVLSAAKWLAKRSGWKLSNLELQKIIYLAHMFFLGRTGRPLVPDTFEAWDYGPVLPGLYHRAKIFGSSPVEDIFADVPDPPPGEERNMLDEAFEGLGAAGAGRLVSATHRPGGAWDTHYIPGKRHCLIPNEDILKEYRGLEDGEPAT
jgi:uncharacterized phage-associated protein